MLGFFLGSAEEQTAAIIFFFFRSRNFFTVYNFSGNQRDLKL